MRNTTGVPKQYLRNTWLHPALKIGASKIHGKGIFTTAPIKIGETVMIWGGVVIAKKDLDESKHRIMTVVPIDDERYLGLPIEDQMESHDEFLNHSCDPNTWLIDEVTVVARRDIAVGEEITLDSATWDAETDWSYAEDGKCSCGSKVCRMTLSPNDWMNTEIQQKYRGHFSPYIQKKIDTL
jgi:uncharacterized protein